MDEIWARSYEPNLKRQSKECKHPGPLHPKKVRPTYTLCCEGDVIVAHAIDGLILYHALPPRHIVNAGPPPASTQGKRRHLVLESGLTIFSDIFCVSKYYTTLCIRQGT